MKQYIIGFITGACLIASAVMFMGAGESGEVGRYQLSPVEYEMESIHFNSSKHYQKSVFKIDTKTGDIYELEYDLDDGISWDRI